MSHEVKLYPGWKQAVKTLVDGGLTFGDRVTKDQIIELCEIRPAQSIEDVQRFSLEFLEAISEIKDTLLTAHSMYLQSDQRGGYVVLRPEVQTTAVVSEGIKSVTKAMRKMAAGVTFIRHDLLSEDERARNADAQAKISRMADMVSPAKSDLRKLIGARSA